MSRDIQYVKYYRLELNYVKFHKGEDHVPDKHHDVWVFACLSIDYTHNCLVVNMEQDLLVTYNMTKQFSTVGQQLETIQAEHTKGGHSRCFRLQESHRSTSDRRNNAPRHDPGDASRPQGAR